MWKDGQYRLQTVKKPLIRQFIIFFYYYYFSKYSVQRMPVTFENSKTSVNPALPNLDLLFLLFVSILCSKMASSV